MDGYVIREFEDAAIFVVLFFEFIDTFGSDPYALSSGTQVTNDELLVQ